MKRMVALAALIVAVGVSASWATGAAEREVGVEPTREIRYVVPFAPGGLSDITAREMERIIREENLLSVPFAVTNIAGASAGEGMVAVRDAQPDGHTLLHHHTSMVAHRAFGVREWGFEAYAPVALLFEVPLVWFTQPDRYNNLEEWVDDVRRNPGRTTVAVGSLGGLAHLLAEDFLSTLGIRDNVHLAAYGGGGALMTAMYGNEDNVAVVPLPQIIDHHRGGDMRILAVGADERVPFLPDVPTWKELGIDVPTYPNRMGVWAPKATPPEIIQNRYEMLRRVIVNERFDEASESLAVAPKFRDGEYLLRVFEEDQAAIERMVEELGLE